jgi:hypothetical protein
VVLFYILLKTVVLRDIVLSRLGIAYQPFGA